MADNSTVIATSVRQDGLGKVDYSMYSLSSSGALSIYSIIFTLAILIGVGILFGFGVLLWRSQKRVDCQSNGPAFGIGPVTAEVGLQSVKPNPGPVAHVPVPIERTKVSLYGRQARIVGSTKNLSQAYSASQNYFAKQGRLWKNLAKFSVPSNRLTIVSSLFSDDELPGGQLSANTVRAPSRRPTSYLYIQEEEGEDEEAPSMPYMGQKEIFKRATIGTSGGTIEVSDIRLEVPVGALDKEVEISIGVTWDTDKYPILEATEALLSPVVVCEPHGLVFAKPVKISFPHCARDALKDWIPKLMFSQCRIDSPPDWTPMTVRDYVQRILADKMVTIEVNHFTLYTLAANPKPGQLAAKDVKILAFAPPLRQGKMHKIRIYCVENYDKESKGIIEDEVLLDGGRRVHPKKSVWFHNTGENLCVTNHMASDGWKLLGDKSAELHFNDIWHGKTPNTEFAFTARPDVSVFHSKIGAHQIGYEKQCQILNISEEAEEVDSMRISTRQIPQELRFTLVMLLTPPNVSGNNWRELAEKIGLTMTEISYLESVDSPVDAVLNKWESKKETLGALHQIMLDIEREDAATEIDNYNRDDASSGQ